MPKLTDIALRNLPIPKSGQITYDDEGSPLRIRVSQGGSKTFLVILGSGRRHTIGRFGEVTLSQAREAARRLRAERTLGRILPASKSLPEAIEEYLGDIRVRANTLVYYKRNLVRLPGTKLHALTPRDIHRILDELGDSSRLQALRTYTAFFKWCIRRHYLDKSPGALMTGPKAGKRARILSDEELRAIWQACSDETNDLAPQFRAIVQLLILTGQRRGEIAALHNAYYSHNQQTITLPAKLTKNKRGHTFPLCSQAISLIDNFRGTERLWFSVRGKQGEVRLFSAWSKNKRLLDRLSNCAGWTLHDLRRSYRSTLGRLGVRPDIAERMVNHISARTDMEEVYDQYTYLPELQAAAEAYGAHFAEIIR